MVNENPSSYRITRSRSTSEDLVHPFDEPERSMRRMRQRSSASEPIDITIDLDETLFEEDDDHVTLPSPQSNHNTEIPEGDIPKRLKDYSSPTPRGFANAIVFPNEHTDGVLRAADVWLVQSVCKFHGSKPEDPIQHIKNFLKIVDTIHTDGATKNSSRLRFFPFTLQDKAKDCYDKLPAESIFTWEQLASKFCEKFFPIGRTSILRDRILRFCIEQGEPIHKSWTRFKDLLRQVPHHGLELWLLVQLFYDRASPTDRRGIYNLRKGRLSELSTEKGWNRIEEYA